VTTQQAAHEHLGLLAHGKALVLYDPNFYKEFLEEDGIYNVSSATGGIKGYIKVVPGDHDSSWGAAEVVASAAVKGYGPMMYDIAMSKSDAPLMPDRSSLSPKAAGVWKHYDKQRSDVKKLPIDDIDNPKTPDPKDDGRVWDPEQYGGDSVNKVYTGAHVDASQLMANSETFVKGLDSPQEFVKALLQAADVFFDEQSAG